MTPYDHLLSAAPELLKQLKIAREELREMWKDHQAEHGIEFPAHVKEMFRHIDAAIEKAEP